MSSFHVSRAAGHELLPACRLLFAEGAGPRADRLRADGDSAGVFVARAGGRVCAAALVQAMPGALGVAWAPRGDSAEAVDAVTVAACDWLRARGAKVCQAFAGAGERDAMAPLERAGFRHTTQLVSMRRAVGHVTPEPLPPARCAPWPGAPTPDQFDLLLATQAGSEDCPELSAPRSAAEQRAGFQPAAVPGLAWGYTLDAGGAPVGALLFDTAAEAGAVEVAYIGLVPAARGRGLAGTLLALADRLAAGVGYGALTLSVDARNAPARKLYARCGFAECDRREVWLASW
jgi:RimJ/RimL family protein N-acetyltransferase